MKQYIYKYISQNFQKNWQKHRMFSLVLNTEQGFHSCSNNLSISIVAPCCRELAKHSVHLSDALFNFIPHMLKEEHTAFHLIAWILAYQMKSSLSTVNFIPHLELPPLLPAALFSSSFSCSSSSCSKKQVEGLALHLCLLLTQINSH